MTSSLLAFFGLTFIQIAIGIIYKFSLNAQDKYSYATTSAIALAELIKIGMSLMFHLSSKRYSLHEATQSFKQSLNSSLVIQLLGLACLYCANNQLTFFAFKVADPASFQLFKSWSAFFTAILLWLGGTRIITKLHWTSILLQVCGLMIVQYDACKEALLLPFPVYGLLLIATGITAITSVWNERLVKSGVSLNVINTVLYIWGFLVNVVFYLTFPRSWGGGRHEGDRVSIFSLLFCFFDGFTFWSLAVVACNSIIGLAVSACYKYADAIVKTFATATSTSAFLFINKYLFNIPTNLTAFLGTFVVFTASYQYMANPAPSSPSSSSFSSSIVTESISNKGDMEDPSGPKKSEEESKYYRYVRSNWWWISLVIGFQVIVFIFFRFRT